MLTTDDEKAEERTDNMARSQVKNDMLRQLKTLCSVSNTLTMSLACLLVSAPVAMAGFDWTPPQAEVLTPPPPLETPGPSLVTGFADNLPLSIVLHQIIPSDYTFTTAQDVDLSAKVSWKGDRPWPDVLEDALAPIGYTATVTGTNVDIAKTALPAMPSTMPTAAPLNVTELAPPPPPPPPLPLIEQKMTWDAARGTTLRTLLENWSDKVQVELYYSAEYDYPLEASIHVEGTFEDAVRALLNGFEHATPQPIGKLHRNSAAGHAVLVVETRGNAYGD